MRTLVLLMLFGCADPCEAPYEDRDGDGHSVRIVGCESAPAPTGEDCDDTADAVHPGAEERCNGVDDDCDTLVDNHVVDGIDVWEDLDGDGVGGRPAGVACAIGDLRSAIGGDCDDDDEGTYPGASDDPCDGVDRDCDGGAEGGWLVAGVHYAEAADVQALDLPEVDVHVCPGEHVVGGMWTTDRLQISGRCATVCPTLAIADGGMHARGSVALADLVLQPERGLDDVGLTVTQGELTLDRVEASGFDAGVMHVDGAYEVRVEDCAFEDNRAERGAALWVQAADGAARVHIARSTFHHHAATGPLGGGAVHLQPSKEHALDVVIVDSSFTDNHAHVGAGGGLLIGSPRRLATPTVRLRDVLAEHNSAATQGGGVWLGGVQATVDSATLQHNQANAGGGLWLRGQGVLREMQVHSNTASSTGGGVDATDVQVMGGVLSHNLAAIGGGVRASGTLEMLGVSVHDNIATDGAGGSFDGLLTLHDSTFDSNAASTGGGGMLLRGDAQVHRTSFTDNTAGLVGGGVWAGLGSLHTAECTWTDNAAAKGGAVAMQRADLRLGEAGLGDTLTGNTARVAGGAVFSTSSDAVYLIDAVATHNIAPNGSVVQLGVHPLTTLNLDGVQFTHNEPGPTVGLDDEKSVVYAMVSESILQSQPGGAIDLGYAAELHAVNMDLGSGATANGWDVSLYGHTFDWSGVVSVDCAPTTCTLR